MTTNCIKFTSDDIETAKGVGSISTLTFDLDITVEPVASSNPMAPTHRVLGRSPRGKLVECGDHPLGPERRRLSQGPDRFGGLAFLLSRVGPNKAKVSQRRQFGRCRNCQFWGLDFLGDGLLRVD